MSLIESRERSEYKYSSGVPFNGNIHTPINEEEQIRVIRESVDLITQALCDALIPIIDIVVANIVNIWDEVLKIHPNQRIVHLAFHHKKERVRKKNRARIAKDFSKWMRDKE